MGGGVFMVVVVVVTHFLRAPCFKTGYAGSAGFAGNIAEYQGNTTHLDS